MHEIVYVKMVTNTKPQKSTLLKLEGLAARDMAMWMVVEGFAKHIGWYTYTAERILDTKGKEIPLVIPDNISF